MNCEEDLNYNENCKKVLEFRLTVKKISAFPCEWESAKEQLTENIDGFWTFWQDVLDNKSMKNGLMPNIEKNVALLKLRSKRLKLCIFLFQNVFGTTITNSKS